MRGARLVRDLKNHLRAKKKLMETHANSKRRSSLSKQRALKILIETINAISKNVLSDAPTRYKPLATSHYISNRQLETIRNRRKPFKIMHMTFSNRPKKTKVHSAASNTPATEQKIKNGLRPEGASWYFLPGHTNKGRVSVHD
jgi:hypothetical protein